MDMGTARSVIRQLAVFGCQAVTITGGGEPLCHKLLPEMIREFSTRGIKIGLVTNGLLLKRLDRNALNRLTWCRISHDDSRDFSSSYQSLLKDSVSSKVDWAFSYVVGGTPDIPKIRRMVEFANEHDFTHVRLVADILNPQESDLESIKPALSDIDSRVIYQPRNAPERGHTCRIGYIKPVIGPDWKIAPCCGYQYALEPPTKDLPPSMVMGDARYLGALCSNPYPWEFGCVRCYYMGYNRLLDTLSQGIQHPEFI